MAAEAQRLAYAQHRRPHHCSANDDEHFPSNEIKMSDPEPHAEPPEDPSSQKKPRGRPPIGAILVDGKWQMTEASILREAERLEQHRAQCRQRYRRNRLALMQHRPELFKKRKWCAEQETL